MESADQVQIRTIMIVQMKGKKEREIIKLKHAMIDKKMQDIIKKEKQGEKEMKT